MVKGNFSQFEDNSGNAKVATEEPPETEQATKNPGQGDGLTGKLSESELTTENSPQNDVAAEKQLQSSSDAIKPTESITTMQTPAGSERALRVSQRVMLSTRSCQKIV